MTAAQRLAWLRRLLEDVPVVELDAAAGDGQQRDFLVSNPPLNDDVRLAVGLNGAAQLPGTDFALIDDRGIRFGVAPPVGSNVVIQYERVTFPDAELESYLAVAQEDWTRDLGTVYRAGCLAIDALMLGAASSLSFGSGAETFDVPAVLERLVTVRAQWGAVLAREAARPAVFEDLTLGRPIVPALALARFIERDIAP